MLEKKIELHERESELGCGLRGVGGERLKVGGAGDNAGMAK